MTMQNPKRILIANGDPNLVSTWSGTPYFFLQAGKRLGFLESGLPLRPDRFKIERITWNLFSWLRHQELGGFQYTDLFLGRLFSQAKIENKSVEFISHFPLLPPARWENSRKVNYYIDATLKQNFEDYGLASKIGSRVREAALLQERKNYTSAVRVVCMSQWAARSVVEDYGVTASKVFVIPPGANLDEAAIPVNRGEFSLSGPLSPLRLGFIGKDWRRKGLPFLLKVAENLEKRGCAVEVVAAGFPAQYGPDHPLLKKIGFINKVTGTQKFIETVRSFHFGCLFSLADASPISNLENLRLGVPVLAHRVGGVPESLSKDVGLLFELGIRPETVAEVLESFVRNPSSYHVLRQGVARKAETFSWERAVEKFIRTWQGSEEFLYDKSGK